jgi:predicted ATPase
LEGSENEEEAVECCFLPALEEARRQEALSWELRAATSLAALWHANGKTAEAHELLSGVYGRFTEGFETHDLKKARGLLDQMRKARSSVIQIVTRRG